MTEHSNKTASWSSAFIDGEIAYNDDRRPAAARISRDLFDYQIIRSFFRGNVMVSDSCESTAWHEVRCLKLWARIDAHQITQEE